jgi:hypothetical protein
MKLHPLKSIFFYDHIEYLGHMIYIGRPRVQQTKVDVITCIPHSIDVSKVRAFMGLTNHY